MDDGIVSWVMGDDRASSIGSSGSSRTSTVGFNSSGSNSNCVSKEATNDCRSNQRKNLYTAVEDKKDLPDLGPITDTTAFSSPFPPTQQNGRRRRQEQQEVTTPSSQRSAHPFCTPHDKEKVEEDFSNTHLASSSSPSVSSPMFESIQYMFQEDRGGRYYRRRRHGNASTHATTATATAATVQEESRENDEKEDRGENDLTDAILDEKQITIIMLLAKVCALYDPTPKTFVLNVLKFYELGLIDSITFLYDLGLVPPPAAAVSAVSAAVSTSSTLPGRLVQQKQEQQPEETTETFLRWETESTTSREAIHPESNAPFTSQPRRRPVQRRKEMLPIPTRTQATASSFLSPAATTSFLSSSPSSLASSSFSSSSKTTTSTKTTTSKTTTSKRTEKTKMSTKTTRWTSHTTSTPKKIVSHQVASMIRALQQDNLVFSSTEALNVSRYEREFKELGVVGQGAFGDVFRAENKLDGNEYAIKKVSFRNKGFTNPYVQNVLREVKCLAKCDHPNVNRYYSAWLEPTWLPKTAVASASFPSSASSTNLFSSYNTPMGVRKNRLLLHDIHQLVETSTASSLSHGMGDVLHETMNNRFNQLDSSELRSYENQSSDELQSPERMNQPMFSSDDSSNDELNGVDFQGFSLDGSQGNKHVSTLWKNDKPRDENSNITAINHHNHNQNQNHQHNQNHKSHTFTYEITLYIQMFLCHPCTLRDWIDQRSNVIDVEMNVRLVHQLMKGLAHVHSRGIVHRDLKPSNIFIGSDGTLKIGDFGLSKMLEEICCGKFSRETDVPSSGCSQQQAFASTNTGNATFLEHHPPPPPPPPPPPLPLKRSRGHTSDVGTLSYASPEQIRGMEYGAEVDSYSLGILVFELFHPFSTRMERAHLVQNLRSNPPHLPRAFIETYPLVSDLILQLVAPDPRSRALPQNLLNHPLFHPSQVQLDALQKQLHAREQTIQEQETLIKQLQAQVASFMTGSASTPMTDE